MTKPSELPSVLDASTTTSLNIGDRVIRNPNYPMFDFSGEGTVKTLRRDHVDGTFRVSVEMDRGGTVSNRYAARFLKIDGQRAEIEIRSDVEGRAPLFLYMHRGADSVEQIVKDGLRIAQSDDRLEDPAYLARILFEQALKRASSETRGIGIGTVLSDVEVRVTVDGQAGTVTTVDARKLWPNNQRKQTVDEYVRERPAGLTLADLSEDAVQRLGWNAKIHAFNSIKKYAREAFGKKDAALFAPLTIHEVARAETFEEVPVCVVEAVSNRRFEDGKVS